MHVSWEQEIMPQNPLLRAHVCASSSYLSVLSCEDPERLSFSQSGRCSVIFPGTPLAVRFLGQTTPSSKPFPSEMPGRNLTPTLHDSPVELPSSPLGEQEGGLAALCSSGSIQVRRRAWCPSRQAAQQLHLLSGSFLT